MRVFVFILLLVGAAFEVAAQPSQDACTSPAILDANGNRAVLGKK